MKVKVGEEIFEVMKPIGRVGAIHFSIMAKAAPNDGPGPDATEEDIEAYKKRPPSPEANERMIDAYVDWSKRVLPNIIVGGVTKANEMTGEQQFAVFMAVMDQTDLGGSKSDELFQIV